MPHNIVKELTSIGIFHDHVKFLFGLNNFVELDNVGMTNFLEDFDLSGDSLNILLIVNLILFQNFYGNLQGFNSD